jgi:hypothetical protein
MRQWLPSRIRTVLSQWPNGICLCFCETFRKYNTMLEWHGAAGGAWRRWRVVRRMSWAPRCCAIRRACWQRCCEAAASWRRRRRGKRHVKEDASRPSLPFRLYCRHNLYKSVLMAENAASLKAKAAKEEGAITTLKRHIYLAAGASAAAPLKRKRRLLGAARPFGLPLRSLAAVWRRCAAAACINVYPSCTLRAGWRGTRLARTICRRCGLRDERLSGETATLAGLDIFAGRRRCGRA